jgi:hypothetical protein
MSYDISPEAPLFIDHIANARLIAELLEAAQDALESLRRLPDTEDAYRVTCIGQLVRAIAKARGNYICQLCGKPNDRDFPHRGCEMREKAEADHD